MATFETFLSTFDPISKGRQFEHFVKWFLVNDPEWSTQVDQVWLWDDYPDRWGPDCGIDLVFKHKLNGEIWAVQAKCYSPEYSITKHDVDKFLSESNRQQIDKRLLISSTDYIGKNAKQVCTAQEKPVTLFLKFDFEQASIEYPNHISKMDTAKRKQRPNPRNHQKIAIKAVEKGFQNADRGQLIMACGTGKTFTTLWIKERLEPETTLVLLPSLSLLSQTLREWTFASHTPFNVLCVCSDESVGKNYSDELISNVQDVSFPTTSDPKEISSFLKYDGDKVIFSTYQSSPSIAEAQQDKNVPEIDLVIADEAHRCTGESGSAFTTILDQSLIKAKKRLFTTATPRTYSTNIKKKASERGIEVSGMDDESVFGSVFHTLNFSDAIDQKLLTDYQVLIIAVDQPMIAEWIQRRELLRTESGETTDAKSLAVQIGLIKAIKDYGLKRMISFHSRVNRAEIFASDVQHAIGHIGEEHRPKGTIWTDFVSGQMSTHKRRLKLDQLKELTKGDIGLLSNSRCLSEGVDVPSLDGVVFIDPRGSQIDIVQAVGRAIRLSKHKTIGTIILPVFIEGGDDADESIQSSDFKPVWSVINALKSHDEVLSFELDQIRTERGRQSGKSSGGFPSKIVFDLPQTIDASFSESLKTYLVERTTSSWSFWFGLLEKYIKEEGHAQVPKRYKTEDGIALGQWISTQRKNKSKGTLTPEQITALESLEEWVWDTNEFQWELHFNSLKRFIKEKGHARVPRSHKTEDGIVLGSWVSDQRKNKSKGTLIPKRISALESLEGWIWEMKNLQWELNFNSLKQFIKEEAHAEVPLHYKTEDGIALGQWISTQRKNKNKGTLTPERISAFESLKGWAWDKIEFKWKLHFNSLKQFIKEEAHAQVPQHYKTEDGIALGAWVTRQRGSKNKGTLTPERISALGSLKSWVWDMNEFQWELNFNSLKQFIKEEGHTRVPRSYKTEDGIILEQWIKDQRHNKKKGTLTPERISALESLEDWIF